MYFCEREFDGHALLRAICEAKFRGVLFDTELPQSAVAARVALNVLRLVVERDTERDGPIAAEKWRAAFLLKTTSDIWASVVRYASTMWTAQWDGWTQAEREQALQVLVCPCELTDITKPQLMREIGESIAHRRSDEAKLDGDTPHKQSLTGDTSTESAVAKPAIREDLRFSSDTGSEEFALLRIILEAKFHDDPDDTDIGGSGILSRIVDQLLDCIVARDIEQLVDEAAERWQRWRTLTPERREWQVACEYVMSKCRREWRSWALTMRMHMMQTVLCPFAINEAMLLQLVNDVDALIENEIWPPSAQHFLLIEREVDAPEVPAIVQRPIIDRNDEVHNVAVEYFSDLRSCRLVTSTAGGVTTLIDEVRDTQRRRRTIETTSFVRFLRATVEAGVRFIVWLEDDYLVLPTSHDWADVLHRLTSCTDHHIVHMSFVFEPGDAPHGCSSGANGLTNNSLWR